MTCRPELQVICLRAIEIVDFTVLEGRRSWERQRELFGQGRTQLLPPDSKHNPPTDGDVDWLSEAVDLAPWPIDWQDAKRFIYLAGIIIGVGHQRGYAIRWGGNWDRDQVILDDQNFNDLPHFELVTS